MFYLSSESNLSVPYTSELPIFSEITFCSGCYHVCSLLNAVQSGSWWEQPYRLENYMLLVKHILIWIYNCSQKPRCSHRQMPDYHRLLTEGVKNLYPVFSNPFKVLCQVSQPAGEWKLLIINQLHILSCDCCICVWKHVLTYFCAL